PGRSAWDATQDIFLQTRSIATRFSGKILELDIEKCFDRIDHKYLMQTVCLPKQYKMGVWRALKAGVMIGFQREDTTEGTPQGGVFSPLLANLALHGIENIGRCIRYADDMIFVIQKICRGKIQYYKYCDLEPTKGQWWNLSKLILRRFGAAIPSINYSSTGYVKIKGNKSPFDGDAAYWVNRMNKKYDGYRRSLIKSQDAKCQMCNLRLRVTDEIHVHHVNKDHSDNRWQNLQIVHRACHQVYHRL